MEDNQKQSPDKLRAELLQKMKLNGDERKKMKNGKDYPLSANVNKKIPLSFTLLLNTKFANLQDQQSIILITDYQKSFKRDISLKMDQSNHHNRYSSSISYIPKPITPQQFPFPNLIKRKFRKVILLFIFALIILAFYHHHQFKMNSFTFTMLKCTLTAMILQPTLCAPLLFPSSPYFYNPFPKHWWGRDSLLTISTQFGDITGANMGSNVVRFTLPFAQPPIGDLRFANPQPITSFNGQNASQMPDSCYQGSDNRGEAPSSEDCLYSTYYVPQSFTGEKLPFIVWYHGGSGILGSSTQDGLDATQWASNQNVIVVVPQYRLNLFGWLSTNESLDELNGGLPGSSNVAGNQAIRDVLYSLKQIQVLAKSMNGDPTKVTIIGQSSGATMLRALLTTPSAQSLFQNAILVSDPMNYGLSSIEDNNYLGKIAMDYLNCSTIECAREASPDAILNATYFAYSNGPQQNQRISGGTPWRAMVGELVTSSIATTQNIQKNVILSTVQNEMGSLTGVEFDSQSAGATTLSLQGNPITLQNAENLVFNQNRGAEVVNESNLYQINQTEQDGIRTMFEEIATDGMWRCSVQNTANNLRRAGTNVWLTEWRIGATYPSNKENDYCISENRICHEDDIFMIFSTIPTNPTNQQKSASNEMQTRYSNFAKQNSPFAQNAISWQPIQDSKNLNILLVGQDGKTSINQTQHAPACSGQAWGNTIKFDWQLYPV